MLSDAPELPFLPKSHLCGPEGSVPNEEPPASRGKARATDPETSHFAAASITPGTGQREIMNALFAATTPRSDEALGEMLYLAGCVLSDARLRTARAELVRMGLVEWTGEYGTTRRGRRARLWRLTERGRKAAR